jgi:hypothetical protein
VNFVVVSAFRSSSQYQVRRWASQCAALRAYLRDRHYGVLRLSAIEGDSNDNGATVAYLTAECAHHNLDLTITTFNHGRPRYGSVEHADRMSSLSKVNTAMLDSIKDTDGVVVYVESDLMWDSTTMGQLVDLLVCQSTYRVIAPMIFAGDLFYDVYAFRGMDGQRFSPFPPYHSSLAKRDSARYFTSDPCDDQLLEVSGVGSCLVMHGEVARTVRIINGGALVEWCARAREAGHRVAVAPDLSVRHPA